MLLHKLEQVKKFMMQHLKIKNNSNEKNPAKKNATKKEEEGNNINSKWRRTQMKNHWIDLAIR